MAMRARYVDMLGYIYAYYTPPSAAASRRVEA